MFYSTGRQPTSSTVRDEKGCQGWTHRADGSEIHGPGSGLEWAVAKYQHHVFAC